MAKYPYWPRYGQNNDTFMLPFEESYDTVETTLFYEQKWHYSVIASVIYVTVIFSTKKIMENRKPLPVDSLLVIWNIGLAIFSIGGFVRTMPEWIWSWRNNSLTYSICNGSFAQGPVAVWSHLYALSKIAEFLDTVFIVARKRPLTFLHWYHHIIVCITTWHGYKDHTSSARWFIFMNYAVHSVMYSYYAVRSLRIPTPKIIGMMITSMQITQMFAGFTVALATFKIKISGEYCQVTWGNMALHLTCYSSFIMLFCNFFYQTYMKRNNRYSGVEKKVQIEDNNNNNNESDVKTSSIYEDANLRKRPIN